MITLASRPCLVARVRLHFDRHAQQHMLLYPEKGLALNASAAAILQLCDGQRSVAEIAQQLSADMPNTPAERVQNDVLAFLEGLAQRALIRAAD